MADEQRLVMDRLTMKVLASEKKREIIKLLGKRRMTLSELSKELGMSFSAVKEHLDEICRSGLIEQKDDGHKWKYYELTSKGRYLTNPAEKKVFIMLGLSAICAIISGQYLFSKIAQPVRSANAAKDMVLSAPLPESVSYGIQATSEALAFPYTELIIFALCILAFGIAAGYALAKMRKVSL